MATQARALYNPRYLESEGRKTINNADISRFMWSHAAWFLKVNEVKKFPDEVADAMLRHFEFLMEVTPKNIGKVKKMQEEKQFKCPQEGCPFETDTKIALAGHMKSHGISKETEEFLAGIDEAAPKGSYKEDKPKILTPEQVEGIPEGDGKDADGVEFYGPGFEKEGTPGRFKG